MVLLPEGGELTLSELRDMAARQQQQIEAQQQLLVAKEQRLKFLKQQEARHHQGEHAAENERLRQLRETVETQELKLRRLRALRGQLDQHRGHNGSLGAELESIRALFNEKEKELSLAVAKVEELTRQLEELRRNNGLKSSPASNSSIAAAELEKLRRELMFRTKLTEQQNAHIAQQRELLMQQQQEASHVDYKITELQQRLQRKRLLNQQLANQIQSATIAKQPHMQVSRGRNRIHPLTTNIATVEPLQRITQEPERTQDDLHATLHGIKKVDDFTEFSPSKNDPKYQTLPYNTKFLIKGGKDQDEILDHELQEGWKPAVSRDSGSSPVVNGNSAPMTEHSISTVKNTISTKTSHNLTNFTPRPFGSTYSSSLLGPLAATLLSPSRGQQSNNSSITSSPVTSSQVLPAQSPSLTVSVTSGSVPFPSKMTSSQDTVSVQSSSEHALDSKNEPTQCHQQSVSSKVVKGDDSLQTYISVSTDNHLKPALPPKPLLPVKPVPPPRQIHIGILNNGSSTNSAPATQEKDINLALSVLRSSDREKSHYSNFRERLLYYQCVQRYRPKQGTFQTSRSSQKSHDSPSKVDSASDSSYSDDKERQLDVGKRRTSPVQLPIRPKPLTIRKTPGLEPPRLKVNQLSGLEQTKSKGSYIESYKKLFEGKTVQSPIDSIQNIEIPPVIVPDENLDDLNSKLNTESSGLIVKDLDNCSNRRNSKNEVKETILTETEKFKSSIKDQLDHLNGNTPEIPDNDTSKSETRTEADGDSVAFSDSLLDPTTSTESKDETDKAVSYQSAALRRMKKGNLKTSDSVRNPRRVSFDPLALLLDAALEGELELVKKTAQEVPNPSAANDEGITALHNAICAGHFEIVTFLVEFGCDVNAQDSDGWTPLHCAASCNNLPMVKFLVERGACIFATTLSDHETAAEKCEEEEEGFDGCSEYLYSMQEKLGILNGGSVYAVYDYEAQNADELNFQDGDMMVVLRKGDDQEREWWWSRLLDQEGYVPRNLLGLYPRVTVKKEE